MVWGYDVDGIEMEDYLYGYGMKGKDLGDDGRFGGYGGGLRNKGEWGGSNVNIVIEKIDERVGGVKGWVKLGVSGLGM